jgi:hypothetical protein
MPTVAIYDGKKGMNMSISTSYALYADMPF